MRSVIIAVCALAALCPLPGAASDDEAKVQALEQQCEQAREAKLKPLREAEIAKCKQNKRNDPGYCERYWRDYGSAMRLANGAMRPRMFDDLPECAAARQARHKLHFE
jgi:hypothetical protein